MVGSVAGKPLHRVVLRLTPRGPTAANSYAAFLTGHLFRGDCPHCTYSVHREPDRTATDTPLPAFGSLAQPAPLQRLGPLPNSPRQRRARPQPRVPSVSESHILTSCCQLAFRGPPRIRRRCHRSPRFRHEFAHHFNTLDQQLARLFARVRRPRAARRLLQPKTPRAHPRDQPQPRCPQVSLPHTGRGLREVAHGRAFPGQGLTASEDAIESSPLRPLAAGNFPRPDPTRTPHVAFECQLPHRRCGAWRPCGVGLVVNSIAQPIVFAHNRSSRAVSLASSRKVATSTAPGVPSTRASAEPEPCGGPPSRA